jgi:hypothetical protein
MHGEPVHSGRHGVAPGTILSHFRYGVSMSNSAQHNLKERVVDSAKHFAVIFPYLLGLTRHIRAPQNSRFGRSAYNLSSGIRSAERFGARQGNVLRRRVGVCRGLSARASNLFHDFQVCDFCRSTYRIRPNSGRRCRPFSWPKHYKKHLGRWRRNLGWDFLNNRNHVRSSDSLFWIS